ncbi:MAG: tripartite tricarboxylate transporter substrate binding protein [Burkholderiaceae bacterium]
MNDDARVPPSPPDALATNHHRRRALTTLGGLPLLSPLWRTGSAHAEDWPARPVKIVVPFSPGGANDLATRAAAEGVSKDLGVPVVVENKPGAGSSLGASLVARSPADGYTFLASAAGVISNTMIKKSMPYKDGDLEPVAMVSLAPSVILVQKDAPYNDLRQFIEASKAAPQGLLFATAGTGSTPHFVCEMLKTYYGARLDAVPYKSGSESTTAIVSGQVQATSEASIVSIPYLKANRFKALCTTWTRRISVWPDLSTATEQGFPEVQIAHWAGIHAPAGTPAAIMDRMARAVDAAMKTPEITTRLKNQGIEPIGGTRADFVAFVAKERERLGRIVKASGMKED